MQAMSGHAHSEADSSESPDVGKDKPGRLPIRSSSERTHAGGSGLTCSIPCGLRTAIRRYVVPLLSYMSIRVKA